VYLNTFTRRLQVFSNHSTDVLLVIVVAANSIVVVGVDLVANRLVQFLYQRVAFLLRQLRVPLRDLLVFVADRFLTENHSNTHIQSRHVYKEVYIRQLLKTYLFNTDRH